MRVISGKAKGRKLATIEGQNTRPTSDMVKETLFNMIAFDVVESEFLDLFAGSGAIGIEALSRGAKKVVFVEDNLQCQKIINENLLHTKLENGNIQAMDVLKSLKKLQNEKMTFDIIFLDPPYEAGLSEPVLKEIIERKILKIDGIIIVEHSGKLPLEPMEELVVYRTKKQGKIALTFLCWKSDLEEEKI